MLVGKLSTSEHRTLVFRFHSSLSISARCGIASTYRYPQVILPAKTQTPLNLCHQKIGLQMATPNLLRLLSRRQL
ncbi:hypothetical protein MTO96_043404 [Rhipicephalus appendiculatus]